MATIRDVAKTANVNVSTVSRALADNPKISKKTRTRIKKIARELGYSPNKLAKSLKDHSTHILGLVIPNILNPSIPGVVRGIEDAAMEKGYMMVLCNTDDDIEKEKQYINALKSMWVDGILMSTASDDSRYLNEIKEQSPPIVLLVRQMEEYFDAVCVDNRQSAKRAVEYLINTGCGRIAIVNGPMELNLYRERYQGYVSALKEHGIEPEECLVWNFEGCTGDDIYHGTLKHLEEGCAPDAILAAGGPLCPSGPHILKAVKRSGLKVPEDVSIFGFDDLEANAITDPPISIISQPFYLMGYTAAKRLIEKIEDQGGMETSTTFTTILNTEIIVRGTTRE